MDLKQQNRFKLFSKLTLIFSLLVILAGSLVKATGAGMGCPDWPKCYGYWVPPLDEEQVRWQSGKTFEKGQIIIRDNKLFVAKENYQPSATFDESQWEQYKKHDYAIYKAEHTIIEYINRLSGAVLGIMAMLMLYFSIPFRKESPVVFWGSILTFILICIEGYLGAMVVSSNLKPYKISIHLHAAFLILIVVTYTRSKVLEPVYIEEGKYKSIKKMLLLSILLLIGQLVLGSFVRQSFDDLRLSGELREEWVDLSGWIFLTHRTFSLLYAGVAGAAIYFLYEAKIKHKAVQAILVLIIANILTGVVMGYFEIPQVMQPTHLVLASILLTSSCVLFFALKDKTISI
jgi:cytochrome c oxidase assembly protein subunit 15